MEVQECMRQIITGPDCTPPASLNHRIVESSELEGTSKGHVVQLTCSEQGLPEGTNSAFRIKGDSQKLPIPLSAAGTASQQSSTYVYRV